MKTILDVGANWGTSTIHLASKDTLVYAFEPTPFLINHLYALSRNNNNFIVVPKAVSDFNGKAIFNIAGQHDWGCSSLLEFSDNLDKTWAGRTDFKVTEKVEVDVIRLDNFIEEKKISQIDYLHCDTQGNDLKVLKGLGNYYDIVVAGVIEVPATIEVRLYKDQPSREETISWLETHNFEVINEVYQQNEFNVYFKRKNV